METVLIPEFFVVFETHYNKYLSFKIQKTWKAPVVWARQEILFLLDFVWRLRWDRQKQKLVGRLFNRVCVFLSRKKNKVGFAQLGNTPRDYLDI